MQTFDEHCQPDDADDSHQIDVFFKIFTYYCLEYAIFILAAAWLMIFDETIAFDIKICNNLQNIVSNSQNTSLLIRS